MTGRAPPLPALRAFAAWVRLGSVSAAAEELQLTPGAVSHQIRALEEFLSVPLIERNGRRWTLTDTGRIYGYQVRQALQDIVDVTERVRSLRPAQAHTQDLRVAVLPSFANGWLLPRLADFTRWHPQVRLQLHGSMDYVNLNEGQVDCAIRFGHGRWPEAEVRPLMGDSLLLLAAPSLLGPEPPQTLQQVLQLPLLHASENWATWLADVPEAHSGVQRPASHMSFTDSTHLLEATRLGMGVALSRRSIADQLLQRRELVQAHAHECPHASAYCLLLPQVSGKHPARDAFADWLQGACARFAQRHALPTGVLNGG
jgi:LysR family glycine cleavage system transcriptional activator